MRKDGSYYRKNDLSGFFKGEDGGNYSAGYNKKCKNCGQQVYMRPVAGGKWACLNKDGGNHTTTCSGRWLQKNAKKQAKKHHRKKNKDSGPKTTNPNNITEFYSGEKPPWEAT